MLMVFGVLGVLIQLFGCGCIIYITRKSLLKRLRRAITGRRETLSKRDLDDGASRKYKKDQMQMVKVFIVILLASWLTSIPLVVFSISILFSNVSKAAENWIGALAYLSLLSKSVVHPIVESYMTYETRGTISKFMEKMKGCCRCCCSQRGA